MNNIAIDGPAGAGKSTIAKRVANTLGFIYVDTGALYRVLALHVIRQGVDSADEKAVKEMLNDVIINIDHVDSLQRVYLNGEDVSSDIRREEVGNCASIISSQKSVRDKLLNIQRELAKSQNVVMDGRDIGTVVLPDAMLKIYLTASVETRAMRRIKELTEKGQIIDAEKIKEDIINRDYNDTHRKIAPLKQARDAICIDSSDLSIDEVTSVIVSAYKEKLS